MCPSDTQAVGSSRLATGNSVLRSRDCERERDRERESETDYHALSVWSRLF